MSRDSNRIQAHRDVRTALKSDHPSLLFIGSGCHYHLKAHGVVYPETERGSALFDWAELLRSADDSGEPPKHADSTAIWESLVARRCAAEPMKSPREHERALLKKVRETLGQACPDLSDPALRAFGAAIRRAGLAGIVTLNFDRTLDLALGDGKTKRPVSRPSTREVGDYRAQLHVDAGGLKVWHAHGMAEHRVRYESIQLGLLGYAESIGALKQRYDDYRRRRGAWLKEVAETTPRQDRYWPPGAFGRWAHKTHREASSWLDVFLSAHIFFIGCGLSQAETDIWYALHARQRELAGLDAAERPQTFYLHPDSGLPPHLATGPAGVTPVMTESHDAGWELLLGRWWAGP